VNSEGFNFDINRIFWKPGAFKIMALYHAVAVVSVLQWEVPVCTLSHGACYPDRFSEGSMSVSWNVTLREHVDRYRRSEKILPASSAFMMEAVCSSETLESTYKSTQIDIQYIFSRTREPQISGFSDVFLESFRKY
jgi:hypothetical protein